MIHSFLHHFDYTYKIKVLLGIRYQGWLPVLKRSPFLSALWLYKVNSKFSCVFIGVLKTKSELNYIFNLFTFVIKTKFIDFSYSPFLNPSIFLPYKSLISLFFSPSFFGLNELLYILCNKGNLFTCFTNLFCFLWYQQLVSIHLRFINVVVYFCLMSAIAWLSYGNVVHLFHDSLKP